MEYLVIATDTERSGERTETPKTGIFQNYNTYAP